MAGAIIRRRFRGQSLQNRLGSRNPGGSPVRPQRLLHATATAGALLETAPWERDRGHNERPRHRWFLDLADAFPEVTLHGFTRDRFQHSIVVEGFDLIAPAERVLESVRWVDRSLAGTDFSRGDDTHLHRIGDPDHAWEEREDGETGEDAHDPAQAGRWHHWRWWD